MKLFPSFCLILTLVFLLNPAYVFSVESSSELSAADTKLVLLEEKAKRLKTLQEEIRQKQTEIDTHLDILRVRINRT